MANKKFSEFELKTSNSDVQFVVGYNGTENVRIAPSDVLGAYLPLAGGTMTGTNGVVFPDNFYLNLGTSSDFEIYHDGNNSYLKDQGTGELILASNGTGIKLEKTNGEKMIHALTDGAVELYYDSVKKFETTTTGVSVTGDANFDDGGKAIFGSPGNDLEIYHDGGNSYIKDIGTGSLVIQSSDLFIRVNGSENALVASANGPVSLYHNNVQKFATTSLGATVTGDLLVTGTITGVGGSYLPLAGGTLTGALTGTSATFNGNVSITAFASIISDVGNSGLQIRAKDDSVCYIDFGDSADSNIGGINYSNVTDTLNFRTGNLNKVTIDSSGSATFSSTDGQLLIDTSGHITSFQTLDVATAGGRFLGKSNRGLLGSINIEQATTGADGGYMRFETSPSGSTTPTEKMRLDSAGNLAIGGSGFTDKLTVVGDARITGVLKLASGIAGAPSLAHRSDENTGFFPQTIILAFQRVQQKK